MVNEGTYSTAKSYKKISTEEQKQICEVLEKEFRLKLAKFLLDFAEI